MALGAFPVQNGRPAGYASQNLTPAEKNYSATEKKCLSVAWSLRYFHSYYVHGATLTIICTNDAVLLKAFLATKDPKGRNARWIVQIWTYEFNVQHRKGKDNNQDADAFIYARVLKAACSYTRACQD